MIAGIGVDVVDLQRFTRAIERTPRLRERLFTEAERTLPVHSLAARFAAKEALIKALGGSEGVRWHDMEIVPDAERNPGFVLHNVIETQARERGITSIHVSMTHDAGVAMAFVVAESLPDAAAAASGDARASDG